MKKIVELDSGWSLKKAGEGQVWLPVLQMPAQVQDVLYDCGMLPEEFRVGWCREALYIGENDWIYKCCFQGEPGKNCRILFEGLDTAVHIYLNGEKIGFCDDFYLPAEFDITHLIEEVNILYLHFISPIAYMKQLEWEEKWDGSVMRCKAMRKPIHDFPPAQELECSNYQGAVPYFTPVGVYAPVKLIYYDHIEITETDIRAELPEVDTGVLKIHAQGKGAPDKLEVWWHFERDGRIDGKTGDRINDRIDDSGKWSRTEPLAKAGQETCIPVVREDKWELGAEITVSSPLLWYPRGFGEQNLAAVELRLYKGGKLYDCIEKKVGFRNVENPSPFAYIINGKKVRLYGGSLDPLQGYTHCYQPEREKRLFEMVENANMNTLRIWGEGIPLPDDFYEECDRRGILVWQEFFLGHGAYPDSDRIRNACIKEAETLVKRLRHHPSLLLWCGGNETLMGAEFVGVTPFGREIFEDDFDAVVKELDVGRYYHPNSPYGGDWADDPRVGDYHTYDCVWEYPYQSYPNFISEHIRTAPPVRHSLERMIHGELEPEGYSWKCTDRDEKIMPDNWLIRSHIPAQGRRKTGDYWEFYDAENADDFLYQMGASYGKEIRRYGEQVRIGNRNPAPFEQRSKGYFACKLVDTWPKIYCASIDFFQEGYIPYYTLKRLFSPFLFCFQREESIRLWGVNDTNKRIKGLVKFGIMDIYTGRILKEKKKDFTVEQGEAVMIEDLASFAFFPKDCVLFALMDNQKESVCIDYVDIERHLRFPEPELQVELKGNELRITAKRFARCVQILGEQDGDKFGWLFSDNYFDMLPGQKKAVRILGDKEYGKLLIKSRFGREIEAFLPE